MKEEKVYTVWLDGVEVTDTYVTKQRAEEIAAYWERQGYNDVVVERVYF
jgi:hypothetical protein